MVRIRMVVRGLEVVLLLWINSGYSYLSSRLILDDSWNILSKIFWDLMCLGRIMLSLLCYRCIIRQILILILLIYNTHSCIRRLIKICFSISLTPLNPSCKPLRRRIHH